MLQPMSSESRYTLGNPRDEGALDRDNQPGQADMANADLAAAYAAALTPEELEALRAPEMTPEQLERETLFYDSLEDLWDGRSGERALVEARVRAGSHYGYDSFSCLEEARFAAVLVYNGVLGWQRRKVHQPIPGSRGGMRRVNTRRSPRARRVRTRSGSRGSPGRSTDDPPGEHVGHLRLSLMGRAFVKAWRYHHANGAITVALRREPTPLEIRCGDLGHAMIRLRRDLRHVIARRRQQQVAGREGGVRRGVPLLPRV